MADGVRLFDDLLLSNCVAQDRDVVRRIGMDLPVDVEVEADQCRAMGIAALTESGIRCSRPS
jgi:hypothetical protein